MATWRTENRLSNRDDFTDLLAWVKASERRVDILTSLSDSPKNSTEFATRWDVSREAVMYHLKLMRQGGPDQAFPSLVQIETPSRERYRLWGLTDQGEQLVEYLN